MKLKILHINDVHSNFEALARIASAIEQFRDGNTLVFDAGDNADFSRVETEGTNGRVSSALLNKMGFTARVFGNNEGFAGKENGRIISETSNCPIITCNMYDMEGKKLDFVKDALTLSVSGARILVIGVTAPSSTFYPLFNIDVRDPEQEIRRVLAENEKMSRDLLIIVSHLGLARDQKLASSLQDIDVIIGGHSHSILEKPLLEKHTIICQAGHLGQYLGELTLDLDDVTKKIHNFEGRIIPSRRFPQDPAIMKLLKDFATQADKMMSKELYSIDVSLDHSLTEENAIGNLLADALKDLLNTEIGIINSGAINHGIRKGNITKKLLHELSPSPLNPTYMEVKGGDIQAALEKSLTREYQLSDGRGAGFRGTHLGNLQVSHNVLVRLESSNRVKSITVDERPLDPEKWYTVGTSDYLQRGTGYRDFANNRNDRYRPEFFRDVLEQYLKQERFLKLAFSKRFVVDDVIGKAFFHSAAYQNRLLRAFRSTSRTNS